MSEWAGWEWLAVDVSSGSAPPQALGLLIVLVTVVALGIRWQVARGRELAHTQRMLSAAAAALTLVVVAGVTLVRERDVFREQMQPDAAVYSEAAWNIANGIGYTTSY